MIQTILLRRAEKACEALSSTEKLASVVDSLNEVNSQIEARLLGIAAGGNRLSESASQISSILSSIGNVTRKHSARYLFREIEKLRESLWESLCKDAPSPGYIEQVITSLERFAEAYDNFVAHQASERAVPLLREAQGIRCALDALSGWLKYFVANLQPRAEPLEGETEFSLVLVNVDDVADFGRKLLALASIYSELSMLVDVSNASYPLRLAKIESGSWWARVFGESKIIALMTDLMKSSAGFLHRNYTTEGKIASIPSKIDSMNEILNFSNRLKESGVDVTNIHEELAKGAFVVANDLNTLLGHQPVVEINGEEYSVFREQHDYFLKGPQTPRIGNSPTPSRDDESPDLGASPKSDDMP